MSAFFASASSQRLLNTASPVTAYPISVGMWVMPTTAGALRTFWSACETSGASWVTVQQTVANAFTAGISGAGANAGTVVANTWFYLVCRFINATNRRIATLSADGIIAHGTNAVSNTPVAMANMSLGGFAATTGSTYLDGRVAEWWVTNTDIQADGLQLSDATLRQLARGGPFSLPYIAKDIVDYRSLYSALGSDQDREPDYVSGNKGRQTWVNTNGVIRAAHPPLASGYRRPLEISRPLWINSYPDAAIATSGVKTQIYMYG